MSDRKTRQDFTQFKLWNEVKQKKAKQKKRNKKAKKISEELR